MNKIKLLIIYCLIHTCILGYVKPYLLEEGFFNNNDFLMPHRISLFETHNKDLIGLDSDSVSNVFFNPALLSFQNKSAFYIDFNSQPETDFYFQDYYSPCYDYNKIWYPSVQKIRDPNKIKPLLQILSILKSKHLPLTTAIAYNLKRYEGDYYSFNNSYYPYQDLFLRNKAPIVRIDGINEDTRNAHSIDIISSWKINDPISVGLKISYLNDNSKGSYGWLNNNNSIGHHTGNSYDDNKELKKDDLEQFEISGATNYNSKTVTLGLGGGIIFGSIEQNFNLSDTSNSFSEYTISGSHKNTRLYNRYKKNNKFWKHDGKTYFMNLIGDKRCGNVSFVYKLEYLKNYTDVDNNASFKEESFHKSNTYSTYTSTYNYHESIQNNKYAIKGSGKDDFSKVIAGVAIKLNHKQNYLSIGALYSCYERELEVFENSQNENISKNLNGLNSVNHWVVQKDEAKTKYIVNENIDFFKIPISLTFKTKWGLKLKTTLIKTIGNEKVNESAEIQYLKFHYADLVNAPNNIITDMPDEIYKSEPENKNLNFAEINTYLEYDFTNKVKIFLSLNNLTNEQSYHSYYNLKEKEDNDINFKDWKFGVFYNF